MQVHLNLFVLMESGGNGWQKSRGCLHRFVVLRGV